METEIARGLETLIYEERYEELNVWKWYNCDD